MDENNTTPATPVAEDTTTDTTAAEPATETSEAPTTEEVTA